MRRIEWMERLQYLALSFGAIGLLFIFISLLRANQSLIALAAPITILALVIHNVLHFLKVDSAEDLMQGDTYTRISVLASLLIEALILAFLLYGYLFPDLQEKVSESWFPLLIWVVVPVALAVSLVFLNLYLPASYRMEELRRKATLRQSQALKGLREDIKQRTEQLLAMGVLPHLQRARQGKEVPLETMEESLRVAIQKIGGIESILQYMILDKYLELLEGSPDSISRSVLWKWTTAVGAAIAFVYQIVMAILALLRALSNI